MLAESAVTAAAHKIDSLEGVDVAEKARFKVFLLQQPEGTMAGWTSGSAELMLSTLRLAVGACWPHCCVRYSLYAVVFRQ